MRKILSQMLFALSIAPAVASAQTQPTAAPEPVFEAASIRPSHFSLGCYSMLPPGSTHYAVTCVTLRSLIALAWKLHPDNIQGSDAQTLETYYDLTATSPGGRPWTRDDIPPMLRQLLTERFHVAVHTGEKQVSATP